jgi:predicted AAA+ superfamily ATPase
VLENIVYFYARSMGCAVSVGRIGKLECDFIVRDAAQNYAYVQVARTIAAESTEEREYAPLEAIRDAWPKYVMTTDTLLQRRNGVRHVNLIYFLRNEQEF